MTFSEGMRIDTSTTTTSGGGRGGRGMAVGGGLGGLVVLLIALFLGVDPITQGNWGGAYGGDGYVLVNWNNGSDVESLPAYVSDVSYSGMSRYMWNSNTADVRGLPAQPDNSGTRRAAVPHI